MSDVALRLREIVKAQKISQRNFANEIGLRPNSVNLILQGKRTMSFSTFCKIIDKLNITPNELFYAQEKP